MKPSAPSNYSCRCCKYYEFEGHRGGECQRLGVSVQGTWAVCTLMVPSFSHVLGNLDELASLETQSILTCQPRRPQSELVPV